MKPDFCPKDRAEWRSWLSRNHHSQTEVWLVFIKKHTGKANLSYNDAVEEALCFGWIDGIKKSVDEDRYTHRFTPRRPGSRWSPTNKARVERVIDQGLMTESGLRLVEVARESGKWDEAEKEPAMPEELGSRLTGRARQFFDGLTATQQRHFQSVHPHP